MRKRDVRAVWWASLFAAVYFVSAAAAAESVALRYLALGDSYTIGEGVTEDQRWPNQLASRLRAAGINVSAPDIVATTGWTTDEFLAGLSARRDLQETYDLITLSIGVNDQYRGRGKSRFLNGFVQSLGRAIEFAGHDASRVIVVSIPDWGVTPFAGEKGTDRTAVAEQIDAFNQLKQRISNNAQAGYVDVTSVSRSMTTAEAFADDGLHPSGGQYSAWVELILPIAQQIVDQSPRP